MRAGEPPRARNPRAARRPHRGATGDPARGRDDFLIARAEDLRLLRDGEDAGRAIGEVAALGRLGLTLRQGEIFVPDPMLRRLVARRTTETIHLEEVKGEYERELSRHEAWLALLGYLQKGRGDA